MDKWWTHCVSKNDHGSKDILIPQKVLGKNTWSEKKIGSKNEFYRENFFGPQKLLEENFGPKKSLGQKKIWGYKNFGLEKC